MTVCLFGIYKPDYSRNRILVKGLRANGVEILECNSQLVGVKKYFDLIRKHWQLRNKYDSMLVAFPGYQAMILAKFLTRRPIVFDAFFSIYNQATEDRKTLRKFSLRASYYWLLDWLSCTLANKVLLDTSAHIDYFVKKFWLKRKKFIRVFVGTDPEVFYPRQTSSGNHFLVHFHGYFIPLQGTEYIIEAANILKNEAIKFQIIGSGQDYARIRNRADDLGLDNIIWVGNVPYSSLNGYVNQADICLGIFGNTIKSNLVIPNKVFEALACQKPVLTSDTPAIRELFIDKENILLCKPSDSADLARKILELKTNDSLRHDIAQRGFELFGQRATPVVLCKELKQVLERLF